MKNETARMSYGHLTVSRKNLEQGAWKFPGSAKYTVGAFYKAEQNEELFKLLNKQLSHKTLKTQEIPPSSKWSCL